MKRTLTLAVALLSLTACASANKRLEQGQKVESTRPAEAAERYIQALKKDGRLDSARAGLKRVGAVLTAQYMRTATDPATQAPAAADAYLAFDDLQKRALEVGVFLPEPTGYAEAKRAMFDKAIARAISDAPLFINARQYSDALSRLQRASTAYQPSPAQVSAMGAAGADVMLAWARADVAAGSYRAGYERVERMPELAGASSRQVDDARTLMSDALARGTRRIAVLPPWGTANARSQLPDDAILALTDALVGPPWTTPPPFIAVFPADQVEREVRYQGLARRTLTSLEASRIARSMNADFAIITDIDSVSRADGNVRVTRRPARTTRGVDTAYFIEEGTARLYARASVSVIDRDGQHAQDFPYAIATVTAPFTRVRYSGDYRTLDLRQAERDLFQEARGQGELGRSFASAMSPRLAEAVFNEVLRRIP
jgi:hypothetical protein